MRTITVMNPQTNTPLELNSSVTTWGELKSELLNNNINPTGMKGLVRETRVSLESDAAMLPETGFTLFLSASKMTAGINA